MMQYLEKIGLWESVIIIVLFSAFVIVADELLHARKRKRTEAERRGH